MTLQGIKAALAGLVLLMGLASAFAQGPKDFRGIYGKDDRKDFGEISNPAVKKTARAAVAIFDAERLPRLGEYSYQFSSQFPRYGDDIHCEARGKCGPLCTRRQAFTRQFNIAGCSGTLIAPDLVLTAGHCFVDLTGDRGVTLKDARFIFGHTAKHAQDEGSTRFSFRQVYSGKRFIGGVFTSESGIKTVNPLGGIDNDKRIVADGDAEDWAVVELDREVLPEIAEPVTLRLGRITDGAGVAAIGYPDGLPLKHAPSGKVLLNQFAKFFVTDLDTFHGNSGSGVFLESTYELVGILVRGGRDYRYNEDRKCVDLFVCQGRECIGEAVTRIDVALRQSGLMSKLSGRLRMSEAK